MILVVGLALLDLVCFVALMVSRLPITRVSPGG